MAPAEKCYTWLAGVGGHGKTLLLRQLYRARIARGGCGVFVDPLGKNGDLGKVFTRVKDLPRLLTRRPFSAVYQSEYGDDPSELWPALMRVGRLMLGFDEMASAAASDSPDKAFTELVRVGRNNHVDIAGTFQAPIDLSPRIRQQADVWISFRQAEPDYAAQLARKFMVHPRGAAMLLALPRLHYLRSTLSGGWRDVSAGVVPCPTCGALGWMKPHRSSCPLYPLEPPPVGGKR